MEVEGIGLDAVEVAVGAELGLALVEVALGAGLAVELFDLVGVDVEAVAVVGLLVGSGEAAEDEDVGRHGEEAAALKTDPVCVLLDLEVERVPGHALGRPGQV